MSVLLLVCMSVLECYVSRVLFLQSQTRVKDCKLAMDRGPLVAFQLDVTMTTCIVPVK